MDCCIAGDEELGERLQYIVEELHKVQDALGGGYLSAFPKEHFIRLQSLQAVWAPFYVVSSSPILIVITCVDVLISTSPARNESSTSPQSCVWPLTLQPLGPPTLCCADP